MANLKWDHQLTGDQRANPVVETTFVELGGDVIYPTEQHLARVFQTDGFKLQTWGRRKDSDGKTVLTNDPHWIAVKRGTPLHYDPKYPRYSHHLKIRVDDGIFVRGLDQVELELKRGTYYVLDAHSPHQVFHKNKFGQWNVAASIDSHEVIPQDEAVQTLLNFVRTASFVPT